MEIVSLEKAWANFFKGGPGSGNFGHAGRPGEVGGSASEGEGGGFTDPYLASVDSKINTPEILSRVPIPKYLYHVTSIDRLESIEREGLKVNKERIDQIGETEGRLYLSNNPYAISEFSEWEELFQLGKIGVVKIATENLKFRLDPELYQGLENNTDELLKHIVGGGVHGEDQIYVYHKGDIPRLAIKGAFTDISDALFSKATKGESAGHPFRGNQYTEGSESSSVDDDKFVFHGTTVDTVDKIKSEGIKANWGLKGEGVYASDEKSALSWGVTKWMQRHGKSFAEADPDAKVAVLKLASAGFSKVAPDMVLSHENIPPERILDVKVFRVKDYPELMQSKETGVIYLGILIDPDRKKKKGIFIILKGGEGSGNFGHAGRPGEVGGSASEGGGTHELRSEPKTGEEWTGRFVEIGLMQNLKGLSGVDTENFKTEAARQEALKLIENTYQKLISDFPDLKKVEGVRYLQLDNKMQLDPGSYNTETRGTIGLYERGFEKINLSKGTGWKESDKIQRDTTGTAASVFRHEYGHHLFTKCGSLTMNLFPGMRSEFRAAYKSLDERQIQKGISFYAKTNVEEGFCESFMIYTHPKYSAGKLPRDIEAVFEKYLPRSSRKGVGVFAILKGEAVGHPFRGNQYTEGQSGGVEEEKVYEPKSVPKDKIKEWQEKVGQWEKGTARYAIAIGALEFARSSSMAVVETAEALKGIVAFDVTPYYVVVHDLATQEKGYGRRLMQKVIDVAAKNNLFVRLHPLEAARGFYKKIGFEGTKGFMDLSAEKCLALATKSKMLSADLDKYEPEDGAFVSRRKGKNIFSILKGGEGSGNFGHAGRPGEVGGSGPGGGGELVERVSAIPNHVQMSVSDADHQKYQNMFETAEGKAVLQELGLTKEQAFAQLAEAKAYVSSGLQTKDLHTDANGNYTKERQALHDKIIDDMMSRARVPESGPPTLLISGGLSGSGKSSTMLKEPEYTGRMSGLVIDADIIREKLARADGIETIRKEAALYQQEADHVMELLFDAATNKMCDVVYDNTMRKLDKIERVVNAFQNAGYRVEVAFAKLPIEKAMVRAAYRYLSGDRFVDPLFVAGQNTHGLKTLDRLKDAVDSWKVWDTNIPKGTRPILLGSGSK